MRSSDALNMMSDSEIKKVLGYLRPLFPKSINAYYFIDNLVKWKKKIPEMDIAVLTPKGGLKSGAVFFYFITNNQMIFSAYAWCKEGFQAIKNSLLQTKRFAWADYKYIKMPYLTEEMYSALEPVISKIFSAGPPPIISIGVGYWLPANEVIKFNVKVPEEMRLDKLEKEHAEKINCNWLLRNENSEKLIEMMMRVNFGRGLFKSNGELVAWAFYWYYGALGVVHTVENERRQGYGKIVVQAVCKEMGLLGLDVHLNIAEENTVSEAFFKDLGFRHANNYIFVFRD
ncbi:uncharacterized protein isoform X4 [Rhodnius prolixus]|uniref:uncharacterized protein isoform X4 n=1 Tax=Rhodnius prolixus TaxID=13249 RepID=UPI003D18C5C3